MNQDNSQLKFCKTNVSKLIKYRNKTNRFYLNGNYKCKVNLQQIELITYINYLW